MNTSEVLSTAAIAVSFLALAINIWGAFYNATKQRELEVYNTKAQAYADFLGRIELLLPSDGNKTLQNNDEIKKLNEAFTILLIKAPDCVIKEINNKIFGGDKTKGISLNREQIKKLQLILHNDLNNQLKCSAGQLVEGDFPHFPFQ